MLTEEQLAKFRARFPVLPPTDAAWRDRVIEAPDDDELRLVYADVLLERGDLMGELIGIQCRLRTLQGAARTKLEAREAELLGTVAVRDKRWRTLRGWITHEVQDLRVTSCAIGAGFVEGVVIDAAHLRTIATTLFATAPIRSLTVHQTSAKDLVAFAAAPWLQRVAHLTVESRADRDEQPVDGPAFAVMIESPHAASLQSLALVTGRIGSKALATLAKTTGLAKLRSLELARQPLRSLHAFARWPLLANLERLSLRDCQLDDKAVADLVVARMEDLVELDLSGNKIGMAGVRAIAGATGLPKLAKLQLQSCGLRANAVETLVRAKPSLAVDIGRLS